MKYCLRLTKVPDMPAFPKLFHSAKATVAEQANAKLATKLEVVTRKVALTATTAPTTANRNSTTYKQVHNIQSHSYVKQMLCSRGYSQSLSQLCHQNLFTFELLNGRCARHCLT